MPFATPALGEIAIAASDMPAMRAVYCGDLGMPLLSGRPNGIVLFRLAHGFAGHTPVPALFPSNGGPSEPPGAPGLRHVALSLRPDPQEDAAHHLAAAGHTLRWRDFAWTGWRGPFLRDPDGNTVELVAGAADPA